MLVTVQSTAVPLVNVTVAAVVVKSGTVSVMVTVTMTWSLPPLFVPFTVWAVAVLWLALGVPDMTPAGETEMPAGNGGSTDQVVTEPPVLEIVTDEIAVPLVPVMVFEEAVKTGTWCWTVNW